MFTDKRSKRVIFVAHCILNQNAISDGTADYPGSHVNIIRTLLDAQVGIIQMPCPELCCLGLDRGNILGAESPVVVENTRIRKEIQRPDAVSLLDRLVEQVISQIIEYHKHGFMILGIVGINRSPSCGVDTTSNDNKEIGGTGVFVTRIKSALATCNLSIPAIGIKSDNESIERVRALLSGSLNPADWNDSAAEVYKAYFP